MEEAWSLQIRSQVAAGELSAAITELHVRLADDVERFVRWLWRDGPVGDVCQDVWANATRALPTFRGDSSWRGWLFSIARNRVVDVRRRDREEVGLVESEHLAEALPGGLFPRTGPVTAVLRRERARVLHETLGTWPAIDRQLLELRYVWGLRPAEIAAVLALPDRPNTMAQRLRRLLLRLRAALAEHAAFASEVARRPT